MPNNVLNVQEVWLHDEKYLLLPGGTIVLPDWEGELGFAHLNADGEIWRYGVQIGRKSDLEFGNIVGIAITANLLTGMLGTIMDGEGDNAG